MSEFAVGITTPGPGPSAPTGVAGPPRQLSRFPARRWPGVPGEMRTVAPAPAPSPLHPVVAATLAIASGVALWAAFPGPSVWPLAPVAVAGLAVAVRGTRARRAFWLGLLTGLAFLLPHLYWAGVFVGMLPWTALATLEALYIAAASALTPLAWRAPFGRLGTVLSVGGLWVAQEALRGRTPFGGFPWARLAFSQSDGPALGYASLGGAPMVTWVVALAGGCLAVAAVDLATRRSVRRGALALAAGVALVAGGGAVPRPASPEAGRTLRVAAVQGDVPEAGLEFNAQRRAVLDNHARATQTLAGDVAAGRVTRPDVVLWPENASDIDPTRNGDAAAVIQAATDAMGVPVLIGAVLSEPDPQVSNTSILWWPSTAEHPGPGVRYVKQHPAPFGEYIPYRSFFRLFSDKVDLVRSDFVAGTHVGIMPTATARLGDVICFEVAYDDLVRAPVLRGADLLVVQTNNATFGYTDESVQQLAMSRLRAVETGRSVVHVSTVGVSALIAPDGREVARSGHFTSEVLTDVLPLRTSLTLATRLGVAPEAAFAGLGLLLVGAAGWTRRRTAHGSMHPSTRREDRHAEQETTA